MLKKKQPAKDDKAEDNIIPETEVAEITEEMEEKSEWQVKAEEYLVDVKRAQADFENYKKRQQESQKELGGYLIEKLVLDIIPVLDNFRAATMHVPEEQKGSPWVVGIQYIEKQLEDVVKSNGVEVIEVNIGDTFDPTIHEAVDSQKPTDTDKQSTDESKQEKEEGEPIVESDQPHVIVKVLQKGFRLGGKVIRPAKVSVK